MKHSTREMKCKIVLLVLCFAVATACGPENRTTSPSATSTGPSPSPSPQGSNSPAATIRVGIAPEEIGLKTYPHIIRFEGQKGFASRTLPAGEVFAMDFETPDSVAEIEKFYSEQFKVMQTNREKGRLALAGKNARGDRISVTVFHEPTDHGSKVSVRLTRSLAPKAAPSTE